MHDIINGIFEIGGGFLILLNIISLYKAKEFKGVHIAPTAFFMGWGFWNLYFYTAVDCVISFWGGIGIVTTNTIWVGQMIYYKYFYVSPSRKQYNEDQAACDAIMSHCEINDDMAITKNN